MNSPRNFQASTSIGSPLTFGSRRAAARSARPGSVVPEPPVLEHPLQTSGRSSRRPVAVRTCSEPRHGRARGAGERLSAAASAAYPPPPSASGARQPERLQHLAVVRIELARAQQLTARRSVVPEHLAVVEPELVPARPVQRLEVDRLRVQLARPSELPRILLDRGPRLERRDRERVQRVRALRRRTPPARAGRARSASTRRRPGRPRSAARRSSRAPAHATSTTAATQPY